MDNHDATKKMAQAYKTIMLAMNECTQTAPLHLMADVRDTIYDVGEHKFGKEFIAELRKSEAV